MSEMWRSRRADVQRVVRALVLVWRSAPTAATINAVLIVVQSILPLAGLYVFKLIIDAVAAGAADGNVSFERVLLLIGLAGLIAVAGVAAGALAALTGEVQALQVTDTMRERLNEKSIEVDLAYYEDPRYYNTLHRAQQEAAFRPMRLVTNLTGVLRNSAVAVGLLILLASVHALLAAITVVAVLPALLLRVRHSRRLHQWQRDQSAAERQAGYLGWLLSNADHAKEIRIFELGSVLHDRYRALRLALRQGRIRLTRARTLADAATQTGAALVVFGSYAFIGYQTLIGVLTVGDLVMYFGAVQRGQSALQSLFTGLAALYEDNLFLSNVDEFLELEPAIRPPAEPRPIPVLRDRGLECENVSFRYPSSPGPVLENIDLEVHPGEMIALVGPNGSGKTTLVKLLCRLYDPDAGHIRLGGIDHREFDPRAYRKAIAVVFQDYARFHLTARDNIWFGDVRHPPMDERVRSAARLSGADAAIEKLPRRYDNVLGRLFADGQELSIGEWQKVALARAFMSDARVLIVDEPTSALDATAEAEVMQVLRQLMHNRAAIVISHRLASVRSADRIYCMERGRIVESGTHDQLMQRGGTYARMFSTQAAMYGTPDVALETSL